MPKLANPQDFNRYTYASNNPVRYTDPTGHWIESALDIAAIAYDVYDISQNGLNWENGLALAADVVSLALPVVAGGGMVVRGIAHADDAVDAIRGVETAGEAVETTSDIVKAVDAACSFTANTPVESANGLTAIGDIELGDLVLAYNEATGTTDLYTVTAVLVHLDPTTVHLTIDGEQIKTTPEHPFFTEEHGWAVAGKLRLGDHIRSLDGPTGTVEGIAFEQQSQVMYNLTVAIAHTFFVGKGQWLVHNSCGPEEAAEILGFRPEDSPAKGPYERPIPSNAAERQAAKAQKETVQGQPCVHCGALESPMSPDHKTPLVVEHYRTGTIDRERAFSVEAVQPSCYSCYRNQGPKLSSFSRYMNKTLFDKTGRAFREE